MLPLPVFRRIVEEVVGGRGVGSGVVVKRRLRWGSEEETAALEAVVGLAFGQVEALLEVRVGVVCADDAAGLVALSDEGEGGIDGGLLFTLLLEALHVAPDVVECEGGRVRKQLAQRAKRG